LWLRYALGEGRVLSRTLAVGAGISSDCAPSRSPGSEKEERKRGTAVDNNNTTTSLHKNTADDNKEAAI